MIFILSEQNQLQNTPEPTVFLIKDNWNDWWEYKTLYGMYYCTSDSIEWIGSVKIGEKGLRPDDEKYISPNLPGSFSFLDERFFSIGQDVSYYSKLNKLGEDIRLGILRGINDVALKTDLYEDVKDEHVFRRSLLRDVSRVSVKGQYRRLANGNAKLSEYFFEYFLPNNEQDSSLAVHVIPNKMPSTNIHVLIGRNGVGKTNLIRNLINYALTEDLTYGEMNTDSDEELFASLVSVSFSSFDNEELYEIENDTKIRFYRICLIKKIKDSYRPKKLSELIKEFEDSLYAIKSAAKTNRWKTTIKTLNSDPIFNSIGIENLIDDENIEKARIVFEKLSSGHKIVLLTITRLVERVEERTLVILDEPELHLHPPLLSAFVRALSDLLIIRNAVALIATHSPVIVQEVPSDCVTIMNRTNNLVDFAYPDTETFGENIGTLTREIFGLEVKESGFHKILTKLVERGNSYEEIFEILDGKLGLEAKTLIRSMIFAKERD